MKISKLVIAIFDTGVVGFLTLTGAKGGKLFPPPFIFVNIMFGFDENVKVGH